LLFIYIYLFICIYDPRRNLRVLDYKTYSSWPKFKVEYQKNLNNACMDGKMGGLDPTNNNNKLKDVFQ
jgi:hypothetical protein